MPAETIAPPLAEQNFRAPTTSREQVFVVEHAPFKPAPETDSQDPRQSLMDEVLSPYHIHYAKGIEGDVINPEASERNFDILLVTTKLIRDKQTTRSQVPTSGDNVPTSIDWFFEKYAHTGLDKSHFSSPKNIVEIWLKKMGPHNDMSDASEDLLAAREWLLEADAKKATTGSSDQARITSKEFGLIAELDMELAEIADESDKLPYREEAAQYLEAQIKQEEAKHNVVAAAVAKMKLTSVNIEIAREKILSTSQLTVNFDDAQYDALEEATEDQLDELSDYFHTQVQVVKEGLDATEPTDDQTVIEKQDHKLVLSVGPLFEVYTYLRVMESLIEQGTLTTQRFRPGTLREESGIAHKIDDLPAQNRVTTDEAGNTVPLPTHGFNYNFDLVLITLNDSLDAHEGMYKTDYYQNKISSDYAPVEESKKASGKFFANKQFNFIQPEAFMDGIQRGTTRRESLANILISMNRGVPKTTE